MCKPNWSMRVCGVLLLWATAAIVLPAQTFTTLHSFDNTDGNLPAAALVQATDGDFYGTTNGGGTNYCDALGCGTVFKITPSGTLTMLHNFDGADGEYPWAGLVQATNGNFYGTTPEGGCCYDGTIFEITPSGALTTLHVFDGTDGAYAQAGLVHATDGNFYGTTRQGGTNDAGTVFTITPSGTLTTLYNFCSRTNCTDGGSPAAGLIQGTDGNFYGTTLGGGANNGHGTVYQITTSGKLTTLHSFGGTDGATLYAGLVQGTDGNFYGTTLEGGANSCRGQGCGTVFQITPSGTLTTLHSFDYRDGSYPIAGLVQGTDGSFYGITSEGGVNTYHNLCMYGCGVVFKITPRGKLTTLYNFCSQIKNNVCPDGTGSSAGLVQDTNGTFYGTTQVGGANATCYLGCGTVFSLSVGLGPFVETRPTSGVVGKAVNILGTNLTGATNVTFNGTAATFTVVSKSLITTNVPLGATTGEVKVTFPHGTRSSNVPFRVK
jgi:uncharacterized repeat protein (TIGR03803 family)